jgi:hypothetical protein
VGRSGDAGLDEHDVESVEIDRFWERNGFSTAVAAGTEVVEFGECELVDAP